MLSTLIKIPYLRFKYKFFPDQAQKFWAQELLNAQGLSAKLGQVLAQGKESELPKSTLKSVDAENIFQKYFSENISVSTEVLAASMGQVFFAHQNDEYFAVKILHPGIKEKLKSEIENILILGKYFAKTKGFNFDQETFRRFLQEVFEEETDLIREARFQEKFHAIFLNDKRFKVPAVIKKYSNETILCQELVKSTLARDLRSFSNFHIFDFFFKSLFQHGVLHGDLNDRNWGLLENDVVVIYDYGCSQIVSERRLNGFKKLLMNKDVVAAFREFGVRLEATWFKGKEQELRDALFIPLLGTITPDWSYSEELQKKYEDKIKILREFTDPWVLLMMRSLFSLMRIYQDRKIPIPMGDILKPQLVLLKSDSKAREIKIEVMENNDQIVFMTLPITALDNIEVLMPEKVSSKIKDEGIDLPGMIEDVKQSGLTPQVLFSFQIEKRSYKVWIE
jgi:RIO-like serine/threonine protein kinase